MLDLKDAAVAVKPWVVHPVRLDETRTYLEWPAIADWRGRKESSEQRLVELTAGVGHFLNFLRLAKVDLESTEDADLADRVLTLAQQVGPMWLCEHGWPAAHHAVEDETGHPADGMGGLFISCSPGESPASGYSTRRVEAAGPTFRRLSDLWYHEPIQRWYELAVQARAAVDIARYLRNGKVTAPLSAWIDLEPHSRFEATALHEGAVHSADEAARRPEQLLKEKQLSEQRKAMAGTAQRWLDHGDARLTMSWTDELPAVRLGSGDWFGYIAAQVALQVLNRRGLAFCAMRGEPFEPRRWNQIYCSPECSAEAAASQEQTRRRKMASVDPERIQSGSLGSR